MIVHFFQEFISSSPLFVKGMFLTLLITFLALFFAIPIGLIFTLFNLSSSRLLSYLARTYIYLVRGTPLIVQMFILYFGLTNIIKLNDVVAASLALAFHNGGYLSEIFRGAIESVSRGQSEAAKSLGMTPSLAYRRIILPQALKRALPSIGNQLIIAVKDSSLAAFISINELFNVATTLGSNNFDQMTFLMIVSVYYLLLVMILSGLVKFLERRYYFAE